MLTPEYLSRCTDRISGLYDELDRTIIADVARRIVQTKEITPTAAHQIDKLQQTGMVMNEVTKQVAAVSRLSEQEVRRLFEESAEIGLKNDVLPLLLAGRQVDVSLSPSMRQVLQAAIVKTNGELRNLTMTTGATASGKYLEAVNAANMKVQSGAASYQQAIREAVREAAADGNTVSYASGRQSKLDVAVRRSVLTGLSQTAGKLTEMNGADLGAEYYEVSAHAGARPTHAVWQGRVFKINGATTEYPNFAESTGYGTVDGLCGVNCRHSFYPFFPGISQPAYTEKDLAELDAPRYLYNGKKLTEYEVSQLMRKMERNIRATKRQIVGFQAAMNAADDPKLKADLKADCEAESMKLHRQQAQYQDLCRQTDHTPDHARTGVTAVQDNSGNIVSWDYSASKQYDKTYERVVNTAEEMYNDSGYTDKQLNNLSDNHIVRAWYYSNVHDIRNRIDETLSVEEQAKQAFEMRNRYKREARAAMLDRKAAAMLDSIRPAPDFETLVQHKVTNKGMTREEAIVDILNTATKTNKEFDEEFGIKGGESHA